MKYENMRITLEKNEKSKKEKIPFWDNHIRITYSKFGLPTSNSVPSKAPTNKQTYTQNHTYRVKT